MTADEIRNKGTSVAVKFGLIFLFVYLAIIEPHYRVPNEPLDHLNQALDHLRSLETSIRARVEQLGAPVPEWDPTSKKPAALAVPVAASTAADRLDDQRLLLREKLVQVGLAQQTLDKAKFESKQYSIPILSLSIDEETLLRYFPAVVFGGLVWLLRLRSAYLHAVFRNEKSPLPVWAAPIPYGRTAASYWNWVLANFMGFVCFGTILILTLRFLFLYTREKQVFAVAFLYAALDVVLAAVYLALIIRAIFFQHPKSDDDGAAFV